MRGKLLKVARPALTLLALGCDARLAEGPGTVQQDILYGNLSAVDENMVVKVEAVDSASGSIWNCSGTLIAPNLLVTARHCITAFDDGTFSCDAEGNLVSTGNPGHTGKVDDAGNISVKVGVNTTSGKAVAKGVSIHVTFNDTICLNDIAFVVLDRALDQPPYNLPYAPVRLDADVELREPVRVVGYGLHSTTDPQTGIRYTRSGLPIAKVGKSNLRPVGDNIPPRTFTIDGPVGCKVDSGGPAFSEEGALIGVFSLYVGDCAATTAVNYYTDVAPFRDDLILPAFQDAGYEPWLEGNSEPGLYGTGGALSAGGASAMGGDSSSGGAPSSGGAGATGGDSSAGGVTNPSASGGAGGGTTTAAMGGSSSNGGSATATTALTGGVTSSSNPVMTGGAPRTATTSTDSEVIYDKGGSKGGSCACRFAAKRPGSLGLVLLTLAALGVRRRKR